MKITIPQLLWYENEEAELYFPPSWSVLYCPMKGAERNRLTPAEMEKAFANPIGSNPIYQLAKGKKEIAVLFDDLSRPTPASQIVPFVLRELEKAGISDGQIRFIAALGAHGAHTATDFRKKLGPEVLDRFPVYNHNPFGRCKTIGRTSRGTPVAINAEVMACDLKIGIGCIVPHSFAGFGGGGKILFPGVAHIDSIAYNHGTVLKENPGSVGLGRITGNAPRLDIEEACRMAGLDVKIDAIINAGAEISALFVGDPVHEHRAGVKVAREVYSTLPATGMDIVVVNTYAKSNESTAARFLGILSLKEEGGDLVVLLNEPAGQVVHYLFGDWGQHGEGGLTLPQTSLPTKVQRLIIVSPFVDRVGTALFQKAAQVVWTKTWDEALGLLREKWGDKANVAVYPDGTIQYVPSD